MSNSHFNRVGYGLDSSAKTVIDVFNLHDNCIEVTADYVIVRGLELKNAGRHTVIIRKGMQNVVSIETERVGAATQKFVIDVVKGQP